MELLTKLITGRLVRDPCPRRLTVGRFEKVKAVYLLTDFLTNGPSKLKFGGLMGAHDGWRSAVRRRASIVTLFPCAVELTF